MGTSAYIEITWNGHLDKCRLGSNYDGYKQGIGLWLARAIETFDPGDVLDDIVERLGEWIKETAVSANYTGGYYEIHGTAYSANWLYHIEIPRFDGPIKDQVIRIMGVDCSGSGMDHTVGLLGVDDFRTWCQDGAR